MVSLMEPSAIASIVSGLGLYLVLLKKPMGGDQWLCAEFFTWSSALLLRILFKNPAISSFVMVTRALFLHNISLVLAAVAYRISPLHPLYRFSGPFRNRITSLELARIVASGRRYRILAEMHHKYGIFVRVGPNTLSVNDNTAVSPIYSSTSAWDRSPAYSLGKTEGTSLFLLQDRELHNFRRRHYWAPFFTAEKIVSCSSMLQRRTNDLLDVLSISQAKHTLVDISSLMQRWAHDVTGELTYGDAYQTNMIKDGDETGLIQQALLFAQTFEILGETPSLFEILSHLPTTAIVRKMEDIANNALRLRRQTGVHENDIVSHLMTEKIPVVPRLSDADMKLEALLALQAGTNGISTALIFACFYLASHPEIQKRLKEELAAAFPDIGSCDTLDPQYLSVLPYLSAVVEESLRLGAPLGTFPRVTPRGGAVLAGEFIPEGTTVFVPAWAQMISEDNFYPDPLSFRPERWLPGGLGPNSRLNRNALMTFSHGPYGCLGRPLAYLEMRVVLAKILLNHELKLPPRFDGTCFLDGVKNMRVTTFEYPLLLELS